MFNYTLCKICETPMDEDFDYMDTILMEHRIRCINGCLCYHYQYAHGHTQIHVNDEEFNFSYNTPTQEKEHIKKQIDDAKLKAAKYKSYKRFK